MGELPKKIPFRVGVQLGGGPPPGYKWGVLYFSEVVNECKCLSPVQYEHMIEQVRELASENDPSHSVLVDVRSIDGYHELRDKGGVLGKINFRIYFYIDKQSRAIIVLGADKKEADGQTSQAIKIRMRYRLRRYQLECKQHFANKAHIDAKLLKG